MGSSNSTNKLKEVSSRDRKISKMPPNKRLIKELASIQNDAGDYVSIELDGDDITKWTVKMKGPPNSPYSNGIFSLSFDFKSYPFKPPVVKFITRVYHPNVKTDTGEICTGLLEEDWAPTLNTLHCINVVRNLMAHPELDHPLETEIAQQYSENLKDYEKTALKYTKDFAQKK